MIRLIYLAWDTTRGGRAAGPQGRMLFTMPRTHAAARGACRRFNFNVVTIDNTPCFVQCVPRPLQRIPASFDLEDVIFSCESLPHVSIVTWGVEHPRNTGTVLTAAVSSGAPASCSPPSWCCTKTEIDMRGVGGLAILHASVHAQLSHHARSYASNVFRDCTVSNVGRCRRW